MTRTRAASPCTVGSWSDVTVWEASPTRASAAFCSQVRPSPSPSWWRSHDPSVWASGVGRWSRVMMPSRAVSTSAPAANGTLLRSATGRGRGRPSGAATGVCGRGGRGRPAAGGRGGGRSRRAGRAAAAGWPRQPLATPAHRRRWWSRRRGRRGRRTPARRSRHVRPRCVRRAAARRSAATRRGLGRCGSGGWLGVLVRPSRPANRSAVDRAPNPVAAERVSSSLTTRSFSAVTARTSRSTRSSNASSDTVASNTCPASSGEGVVDARQARVGVHGGGWWGVSGGQDCGHTATTSLSLLYRTCVRLLGS